MVQQPAWSAYEQVDSFLELCALSFSIHAPHQKPDSFVMELTDLFGNLKDLDS